VVSNRATFFDARNADVRTFGRPASAAVWTGPRSGIADDQIALVADID